jgi:leader peptidase (prepilin peptidase)/N-methyltransferase
MLSLLAFILGASIGSFVQVVASRLHVAPIMKGRSKCLLCGEKLKPLDLVPVLSYLFLRGKCKYCNSAYGVSALIIETIFGATFVLLYQLVLMGQPTLLASFSWLVYYSILFGVLGVMALYDKAHSYIPLSFLGLYLILTGGMLIRRLFESPDFITLFSPLFVALPFLIIFLVTKGKGLGFGDVILFFGVGAFFGNLQGLAVLIISVWLGAVFGLYFKYGMKKKQTSSTAIPFVPFIVLAFLFVLFTGVDVFSIAMSFSGGTM